MKLIPVVHYKSSIQAVEQSNLAIDAGADGVMLIDHDYDNPSEHILNAYSSVRASLPDAGIGVNLLCASTGLVSFTNITEYIIRKKINAPDYVWVDDAKPRALDLAAFRKQGKVATMQYLGGVSFKYTNEYTDDPEDSANQARTMQPLVDIVTTSGRGTGHSAPVDKIRAMKSAITKPLALASGVDASNIRRYRKCVDLALVSSSVETFPGSGEFSLSALRKLVELAHED